MSDKIVKFTDLEVWRHAHDLRISVLNEIREFPSDYRFGLGTQLQRSAISVGSNIAEGFGRRGKKEKLQFYNIARGSLIEVQDQLMVVRDMGLFKEERVAELLLDTEKVHQILNGLIRSVQMQPRTTTYESRTPGGLDG